MRLKSWLAAALLAMVPLVSLADDPPQKEMSAEEKAAMEAMMKAATPGDAHKRLDGMVGTFEAKVTFYDPSGKTMTSSGVSENRWILGNRYVEQRFTGSFMGAPFQGLGYTGYDNVMKRYWSVWMDDMSTGMMTSTGATSDNGKNWTFTGTVADPMSGKESTVTQKVIVTDADHHSFEMWGAGPDGKPMKMMEIAYTRKK